MASVEYGLVQGWVILSNCRSLSLRGSSFSLTILTGKTNSQIKLNQLSTRGSYTQLEFSKKKKKVVSGKTPFFLMGPFCNP